MVSTEGPALAVADINKDGLEDVFMGSSKTHHNAIFLQQPGGKFTRTLATGNANRTVCMKMWMQPGPI